MRSGRDALIEAILEFLADQELLTLQEIRIALEREIDSAGLDGLLALKTRLGADNGWGYYPRDPLAQRIHHCSPIDFSVTARGFAAGTTWLDSPAPPWSSSRTTCRTPTQTSSKSCCSGRAAPIWRID